MTFIAMTWLPLVAAALISGEAFGNTDNGEPLLRHLGIHARFLVALPVLIFGERLARSVMKHLLPRFVNTGAVPEDKVDDFLRIIAGVAALKNSWKPWLVIAALIAVSSLVPESGSGHSDLGWATRGGSLGFGGWWYLCVSRPILQMFLLGWLWRLVLLALLLRRIAKLGLRPVPAHPDGLGGLGFIQGFPRAFVPVVFAMSCVLSAYCAHDVAWHGTHVAELKWQAGSFALAAVFLCTAPLAVFIPLLRKAKRKALAEYGALAAGHDRQVHRRWIEGDASPAPECLPTMEVHGLYSAVKAMRIIPCSRQMLTVILVPVALPMILVSAIEIPVAELLGNLLKAVS